MKKIFIEDVHKDDFKKLVSKIAPKDLVVHKKEDKKYLWLIILGVAVVVAVVTFILVKTLTKDEDDFDDEFYDDYDDDGYFEDEYDENGCLYTDSEDFE